MSRKPVMPRVGPLIGVILLTAIHGTASLGGENAHWGYSGAGGPRNWGRLAEDYALCATGTQQSPADLRGAVEADLDRIKLRWEPAQWTVLNNGHTIQVQAADAGGARIDGETYALQQFHFHTPSEHAIDGRRFAMEVHFVYAHADGRLAVIGVMLEPGGRNDLFTAIMEAAPAETGEAGIGEADASTLIPRGDVLRYRGSLTTPPCSEVVLWTMMTKPVRVRGKDIETFRSRFSMNARPLQPLNRRYVLTD